MTIYINQLAQMQLDIIFTHGRLVEGYFHNFFYSPTSLMILWGISKSRKQDASCARCPHVANSANCALLNGVVVHQYISFLIE
jgi:hypothetical protein